MIFLFHFIAVSLVDIITQAIAMVSSYRVSLFKQINMDS